MTDSTAFRIGQVAALTGLSTDTIRIWERRYEAVTPRRDASNIRVYDENEVARLKLMSQLIEAGARISDIASLDADALLARLRASDTPAPATELPPGPVPLILVGAGLPSLLDSTDDFRVQATHRGIDSLLSAGRVPPDTAVVLRIEQLDAAATEALLMALRRVGAHLNLLLYDFAPSASLERLRNRGVMTLRATSDAGELRQILLARRYWEHAGRRSTDDFLKSPIPAPRFSTDDLARARKLSSVLACECPRHLADLITALRAFENYSTQCEEADSRDASVHAMLRGATAHARATMEAALARLARDDGFEAALLEQPTST